MSVQVEKLDHSMAKVTITVSAEDFTKAVKAAYEKEKGKYEVPGFRKGQAPQFMIEAQYGKVFFETAGNNLIDESYPAAIEEADLDVVSRPELALVQMESDQDFIYTALVAVRPEVQLGEYKGIEIEKTSAEITDEEVDAQIKIEQDRNARMITIESRPVQDGDIVNIDFEGTIEGKAFDGGKGEDYPLTIGSHAFVDGYEEQVIGHSIGDTFDVTVTFPDEYQASDLAGKEAVFKTTVRSIKEKDLPALDDEFASEVSEFETFEEYKNNVKETLAKNKADQARITDQNNCLEKLLETTEVELPELMVQTRIDDMMSEYSQRMQAQGLTLEQYFQYTGMTMDSFRESLKEDAERNLKSSLVLEAVAKAENIEVTEEDTEKEIEQIAESYGMPYDDFKAYVTDDIKENIGNNLKISKAAEFILANATLK